MQIDLPYPPSNNRYWRTFRGRNVVSAEAKSYKSEVAALCLEQGLQPVDGPVAVTLRIRRPAKRRDLDNHLKVLLDALEAYAYHNDNQVFALSAAMVDDKANPGVTVRIERME